MNDHELDTALGAIGRRHVRSVAPTDLRAQVRVVTRATPDNGFAPTLGWRFGSMFSATRFVVAGAIVTLLTGALIIAQYAEPPLAAPGADTDEAGAFSSAGSLAEPHYGHTATLLPDGRVLVVGGGSGWVDPVDLTARAEVWDPETGTFGPAGSLADARVGHTATLLPDGRVLVVGGGSLDGDRGVVASAETWDPDTGVFSPAGSLAAPRGYHSATLLPDGRVLIFGGRASILPRSAEVWDPATNAFSPAGSLARIRLGHTATLLPDGRVFVVTVANEAEVWDPETNAFSPAGSLTEPHDGHTATLLPDGRVLVAGYGREVGDPQFSAAAEIWDPATGTFSPAGSPAMGWIDYATLLPDGRVLVVGGLHYDGESPVDVPSVAEVWDPATGSFSPAGTLADIRTLGYTPTLLPDGRVLIVGGCIGDYCEGGSVASAEIWDPESNTFSPAGSLAEPRVYHSATLLPDGRVLIAGGGGDEGPVETAEVWAPSGR